MAVRVVYATYAGGAGIGAIVGWGLEEALTCSLDRFFSIVLPGGMVSQISPGPETKGSRCSRGLCESATKEPSFSPSSE